MENNFSRTLLKIYDDTSIYLVLLLRGDHRILFMVFEVISSFKFLFVCGEEDKGTFQKRFSGFCPLRGYPPPYPLTENQSEKKKVFFLSGKSAKLFQEIFS